MSSSGSDQDKSQDSAVVEVVDVESVEPSMSEWSSLVISLEEPNPKRVLYDQGLYDPGCGEVCAAYVSLSNSDVFRHAYYNYPCVPDPGISHALLGPAPETIYDDDGQDLYLDLCKQMNQCPVRMFHRALLGTKADISYYGVNPYGVRAMAKALANNNTLTILNLTDNFLNDDACFHLGEMLATNKVLAELILSGCRIGESGALRLCAGLPANRALRALNLSGNNLGDGGADHLANAVFSRANVQEIDLSTNSISGKSAHNLAEALEWNNKITHLNLSRNNLFSFPSGLVNLLEELGDSPLLQYLDLSWNSLCGPKASAGIKKVFKAKNLQHLDISNNKFCTTDIVMDLISFMAKPKKLVTYNVSYNPISVDDALLFITKLQTKAVKVQVLNMDGITVNAKFTKTLNAMKQLSHKKDVVVTHGYVEGEFTCKGPDPRETTLNRVEYICKKPKKNKVDVALIIYQLQKDGFHTVDLKFFAEALEAAGASLDDGLIAEMQCVFPGPPSKKGAKKVDIAVMAEYMKRKWPERKLPPTPPPEPEPEPEPEPIPEPKKGKKGEAGKGKKK